MCPSWYGNALFFSLSIFLFFVLLGKKAGEDGDGDMKPPPSSSSIFRGSHVNIAENVRPRE